MRSMIFFQITVLMNIIMYTEPELDGQTYSDWAKSLGWLIVAFPIVVIPLWFLLRYCSDGGWKVNDLFKFMRLYPYFRYKLKYMYRKECW